MFLQQVGLNLSWICQEMNELRAIKIKTHNALLSKMAAGWSAKNYTARGLKIVYHTAKMQCAKASGFPDFAWQPKWAEAWKEK